MALVLFALAASLAFTGAAVRIGEDIAVKEEHTVDAGTTSKAWWNFPAPSRYKLVSGTKEEMKAMKDKWDGLSDASKVAEYTEEFDDGSGNFSKALDDLADKAKKRDKFNPFQTGFKVWSFNEITRRNRVKLNVLKRAIETANKAIEAQEKQKAETRKEAEENMQNMLDKIDEDEDKEDDLLRMTQRSSGAFSMKSERPESRMIESGDSEAYIPDRASAEYQPFRNSMRQTIILGSAVLGSSLSMDLSESDQDKEGGSDSDEDDMMAFDKSSGGRRGGMKKFGGQSMGGMDKKSGGKSQEQDQDQEQDRGSAFRSAIKIAMMSTKKKPQIEPEEQKQKESFQLNELPKEQSRGSSRSNRDASEVSEMSFDEMDELKDEMDKMTE